jgi:hypothetical protein
MNDDNDRDLTEAPPPPVEAATMPPSSFGKTGPLPPMTVSDVLDVFMKFQQQILDRLDERDKRVLDAIQKIGSDVFSHYEIISKRGDEDHKMIGLLRKRTHKHSSDLQEIKIRLHEIERVLSIESPKEPEPE